MKNYFLLLLKQTLTDNEFDRVAQTWALCLLTWLVIILTIAIAYKIKGIL